MVKMTFDECLKILNKKILILNKEEDNLVCEVFTDMFPGFAGKIVWDEIDKKIILDSISFDQLEKLNCKKSDQVFVIWDDGSLPVIKATLETILNSLNNMISLCKSTFIFNPISNYVIDFYYDKPIFGFGIDISKKLKSMYKIFQEFNFSPNQFPDELKEGVIDINEKAKMLSDIILKLINGEILSENEELELKTSYLKGSAWKVENKYYVLVKYPEVLKFIEYMDELKKTCSGMNAFLKIKKLHFKES